MSDLIERLEKATEGNRGMDAEIAFFITNGIGCGAYGDAPNYTTSLDAALTLVPDKFRNSINIHISKQDTQADLDALDGNFLGDADTFFIATGATPPLALCIAALRARGIQ